MFKKKVWKRGDKLNAKELNRIEEGIASSNGGEGVGPNVLLVPVTGTSEVEGIQLVTIQTPLQDILNAHLSGQIVFLTLDNGADGVSYMQLQEAHEYDDGIVAVFSINNYSDGEIEITQIAFENTLTGELQGFTYRISDGSSVPVYGGESSALICGSTISNGVITLTTPLTEVIEAYRSGREVLLSVPTADNSNSYLRVCYVSSGGNYYTARFVSIEPNLPTGIKDGYMYVRTVLISVLKDDPDAVARGTLYTFSVYNRPYDIVCTVHTTHDPIDISANNIGSIFTTVKQNYLAGQTIRLKATVDIGVEGYDHIEYMPLTSAIGVGEGTTGQFFFGGIVDMGTGLYYMQAKLTKEEFSVTPTPLTS